MSKKYKKKDNSVSNPHDLLVNSTLSGDVRAKRIKEILRKEKENSNKKIEYIAKQMLQKVYGTKDIEEIAGLSSQNIQRFI
jgi:hypothetical protein